MKAKKGHASTLWPRYIGTPLPENFVPNPRIKLVRSEEKAPLPDPMCDYIEGAEWWLARSASSVRMIQRAFDDQEVAILLYETVGAMQQIRRLDNGEYLIRIQLIGAGQWDVDLSLSDARIYLEEPCEGP